jgi:hypothetical protein
MKKLLPVILILVVVVGLGGYLLTRQTKTPEIQMPTGQEVPTTESEETQETETGTENETFTGRLKAMVGLGIPLKCSFDQGDDYQITTWIKGEKFYSEIVSQEGTAQVIFKDDCMWNWSDDREQGIKMCFEPEEAEQMLSGESKEGETDQNLETDQDLPTDVDYNCQPTTVSDAKFNPPSDIEFMDFDQMMEGLSQ